MINQNLILENARIGRGNFRNFAGEKTQYNTTGKRTFTVMLDEAEANQLLNDGWHIRFLEPRDEEDERLGLLDVEVKYGAYPPKIVLISGNVKTLLGEEDLAMLDSAEFSNADLIVRPYNWEVNGKTGVKAYVKSLYLTLDDDDFGGKYRD